MARFPALLMLIVPASLLLLGAGTSSAHAQGENQRRFAVELRLIAGDLRRLAQERLSERQVAGLHQRLRGSLGYLTLLGRQAVQERARPDPKLLTNITQLRESYAARQLDAMYPPLANLLQRYPLTVVDFDDDPNANRQRLTVGRDIDRQLCVACHRTPNPAADNPAPDLFAAARQMTREEFVARLFGGIRGVPATALDNPLSDEDLRGLYAWYRNGDSGVQGLTGR
jgi:mono/diheme cytochrome c family protein